jgi:hypothetical protein
MILTSDDRLEIHELMNRHGHLVDQGEFDRFVNASASSRKGLVCGPTARPTRSYITTRYGGKQRGGVSRGGVCRHAARLSTRKEL